MEIINTVYPDDFKMYQTALIRDKTNCESDGKYIDIQYVINGEEMIGLYLLQKQL